MKNIDKKIDVILRQRLLMGYNPAMNLDENVFVVKEHNNKKQKLDELAMIPTSKLTAGITGGAATSSILVGALPWVAGAIGLGLVGWGLVNFLKGGGRYVVRNKIEHYFEFCKMNENLILSRNRRKANGIAKELWTAFEKKGFLQSGIGTDEQGVYDALKKLENIGEFCSVIDQYNRHFAQGGSSLWREIKDELWQTNELQQVEEILNKLYANAQRAFTESTSCLVKLIKRRFNTDVIPSSGSLLITATRNSEIDQHRGIKLTGLFPNQETGTNWETADGQIKGVTQCHSNGCVIFQGTNGCQYFIDQCNPSGKGCVRGGTNGGGEQGGGGRGAVPSARFCPTGYSEPTDGVYKKCKSGEPVKKLQECLGVTVDGKFGPRTQRALRNRTGAIEFTENQLPQICPPAGNTQQSSQQSPQQAAQVDSEYQDLSIVPVEGQSTSNQNINRF